MLVCFPHAGGVAADYREWRTVGDVPVLAVTYPGRERRFSESLCTSVDDLASSAIEQLPGGPVALFGHSLGALVAFEVARRLTAARRPVRALVVAGQRGPGRPRRDRHLHDLPAPDLLRQLTELGGMDPRIAAEPDLMELLLPRIRADLRAAETWVAPPPAPLAIPVLALGGAADEHVTDDDLGAWGAVAGRTFEAHVLEGGHFFVHHHAAAVRELVGDFLRRHAATPGAMV